MKNDASDPTAFAALAQAYLPRFDVQVPLGSVANGEVFRATDLPTGEQALVKVIPRHLQTAAGGASWEVLREETSRLSKLFHPRVSNLLETVDAPEMLILVMGLPSGTPMRRFLESRPPNRSAVIQWTTEILELLTEAHTLDVVHRFLSLNAVIVNGAGQASLCGFSLTSFAPARALLLSPEQRSHGAVDSRSDVYGAGLLLRLLLERAGLDGDLGKTDPLRLALLKALAEAPADRFPDPPSMANLVGEARNWRQVVSMATKKMSTVEVSKVVGSQAAESPVERTVMDGESEHVQESAVSEVAAPVAVHPPAAVDDPLKHASAPSDTVPLPAPNFVARNVEKDEQPSDGQPLVVVPAAIVTTEPVPGGNVPRRRPWGALALGLVMMAFAATAYHLGRTAEESQAETDADVPVSLATRAMTPSTDGNIAMPAKEMPAKEMHGDHHAHGSTAEAIHEFVHSGVVDNLFTHAALPESDRALLEEVSADLAGLDFHDDPRGLEPVDTLFANNPLLDGSNPFLSDATREHWLAVAAHEKGADGAIAHLEAQSHQTSQVGLNRAEWYEHVAACQQLCGMVVIGLFYEHVRKVEESPHELVRFAIGRQDVEAATRERLQSLISRADSDDRVLLIGRASRIGDRAYNYALSEQRVAAVSRALEEIGVASDRIHGFGLGYEPPQLTPEVARRYGVEAAPVTELNQSVLVVTYSANPQTS